MPARILYAGIFHETHTFIPQPTTWKDFEVRYDQDILGKLGDQSPTDGLLEVAKQAGWEVIATVDARAMPSGPVEDSAMEKFWEEFSSRARPALAAGVDGIFLVLHGAMVTPKFEDVEGELLERLRALPGAGQVPLFAVFDLHANVSRRMCAHANGLVAYRKNPHTDAKEAAVRAASLLERCLREKKVPRTAWCRVPLSWPPPGTGTAEDPMISLEALAAKIEQAEPGIWAYNIAPGFAFADTSETGLTLTAVTIAPSEVTRQRLEEGAKLAWSLREKGNVVYPTAEKVLAQVGRNPVGPVLLVEPADNIGGGAPGDGTGILRAFLQQGVEKALVAINDPESVAKLAKLPIGGSARLAIGGRGWKLDPGPVELEVVFVSRSDGNFTLENPHSHLASMSGIHIKMGPSAVVRHRGVTILLTSLKTPPFDLGQFRSQGINPEEFSLIGVKAAVAHRAAYDPITKASYFVDTPGPCSSNLSTFPYRRLRRPVYPLDPVEQPAFLFA